MSERRLRVADVFRCGWAEYDRTHAIAPYQARAVRHLLRCRTAALGGHLHRCDRCGREVPLYNSCQDRHCPSCGTAAKERWLDARAAELLPVRYFHCVFTLPHALNGLVDANRARLIGELFSVVDWVLQHFAADPQWRLEGMLGFVAVLHTWTQRLLGHFHVHCLIPGGVWREARGEWIPCRGKWLFGKDALAAAFRSRFLKRLRTLRRRGKLAFTGPAEALGGEAAWEAVLERLRRVDWIVYPKCTARADRALDYLGRYTHKTVNTSTGCRRPGEEGTALSQTRPTAFRSRIRPPNRHSEPSPQAHAMPRLSVYAPPPSPHDRRKTSFKHP